MMRRVLLLLLLLFLLTITAIHAASDSRCSGSSTLYQCPSLCNGTLVTDCLSDCDGYTSADAVHNICLDRKLFQPDNTDPTDFEHHYHFLWNDLVGAVVWFVMAGVATASAAVAFTCR